MNPKNKVKSVALGAVFLGMGTAVGVVALHQQKLEKRLEQVERLAIPQDRFTLVELLSPGEGSVYIIRPVTPTNDPRRQVDAENLELYHDSLRRTYFPSSQDIYQP